MIRLNKFISEAGIASRRKADELIEQGRVMINGKTITTHGINVDPANDIVLVDGEKIKGEEKVYFLLNKPTGTVTTTSDERKRPKVTDLIKTKRKIFPVGRLDFNTTGVLLLTNDGDFANLLAHPKNKTVREYEVTLDKELSAENQAKLLKGIYPEGKKGKFLTVTVNKKDSRKFVTVTADEGRNHFVKLMFSTLGYRVKKLHRSKFGFFNVQDIGLGNYIEIPEVDIKRLIKMIKK